MDLQSLAQARASQLPCGCSQALMRSVRASGHLALLTHARAISRISCKNVENIDIDHHHVCCLLVRGCVTKHAKACYGPADSPDAASWASLLGAGLGGAVYNEKDNNFGVAVVVIGGLQAVLHAIRAHPSSAVVQEAACGALKRITQPAENGGLPRAARAPARQWSLQ
jgi:hypothetical protein